MSTQLEIVQKYVLEAEQVVQDKRNVLKIALYNNMFSNSEGYVADVTDVSQIPVTSVIQGETVYVLETVEDQELIIYNNAKQFALEKNSSSGVQQQTSDKKRELCSNDYYSDLGDGASTSSCSTGASNLYSRVDQLYALYVQENYYINNPEEGNKYIPIDPKSYIDIPDQTGHIFPVTAVAEAINKLIGYNNQLSNFTQEVEAYENSIKKSLEKGPGKINLSWIGKIVEKFCKRINYWLAWLRYTIIKGLSGIYKAFTKTVEPIQDLVDSIKKLAEMDLSLDTVVSVVGSIIGVFGKLAEIFNKPIAELVKFVQDIATYGPPLVEETTQLSSNIIQSTQYSNSLRQEIDKAVNDTLNTDLLDPDIREKLKDKYLDTSSIDFSIRFEPIKLDDIITGNVEKPKWDDYK